MVGIVICFAGYQQTKAMKPEQKLQTMVRVLEKNGVHVQKWSWLAKAETEQVHDERSFHQLLDELKRKAGAERWNVEQSQEGYKAEAVKKFPGYEERLVVTWANVNTKDRTFILYEAKGTKWDEAIVRRTGEIFSQKPTIYTCAWGEMGDKIKGVLQKQAGEILKDLSAKPIEQLEEMAFVSVSAYTGEWNDALIVNREKINVQVALRSAGDKTAVVVGTPIITSEY
ncbi:YwmB family TATA-box binding protein [Ectobacillus ponti]|uniref:YwmB family TATA-box binding protein n=1 Tax=Ectobacillus ponti TaxID=2961894 RepID=A0AA42BRZ4_9BACI|nr:YwmB family TATA-box binding protein [Ectobacillus ponti]MCP8967888.1 YwmB family TATA-box binding protein [Ectobacillus ponti]